MIDTENKLSIAEDNIEKLEKEKRDSELKSKTVEDNLSQMEKQNIRIKEEYQKCAHDMKDLIQKLQEAGNELERVGHERDEVKQSLDLAREECNEKEKLLKQTKEKSNNLFSRLDGVENIIKGKIFNTYWNLCTVIFFNYTVKFVPF